MSLKLLIDIGNSNIVFGIADLEHNKILFKWRSICNVNITSDDFAIDGIFGENTRQAVMNYQAARDLEVCGIVNAETWNRILK